LKVLDSYISFDIILYPFISGQQVFWNEIVTDREEFDRRNAIVRFNVQTKSLEYSIIYDDTIEFPTPTDVIKIVKVDKIPTNESIIDYFIDQQNGLFYVATKQRIYCYPFIIPQALNKTLDINKTIYQACRIDYIEDDVNEKFIFDVFPTAKANGIDSLDIYLNGEMWQDGLMIDLFREKLIDNRIDIPFNDLFSKSDDCLIEFKTFGSDDSTFSVYVIKPMIKPLYIKRLNAIDKYNDTFNDALYTTPNESSTSVKYPTSKITTGLVLDNSSNIYKLSKHSNIVIDGFLITEVFKTFCYSNEDYSIITHDSITHITKSAPETLATSENISEAGIAETGSVSVGTVNNNIETTYNQNSVVGLATSGNAETGGFV